MGEEIRAFLGHLFLADSGRLDPPERQLSLAADGGLVDVDHSDFGFLHESERGEEVAGVDARSQAVLDVVGQREGLLEVARALDGEHRSEDLVARQPGPGLDLVEHGRGAEEAVSVLLGGEPLAAAQEPRPFRPCRSDGLEVGLEL